MSKKKSGLLIAFGAMLGGAVAAGISYYLKLKSFNDELDQDFHEYEDEETPSEEKEEKTEYKIFTILLPIKLTIIYLSKLFIHFKTSLELLLPSSAESFKRIRLQ